MMSEPSVIRSRLSPATFMTRSTTASTSGTDVATTRPERHPSDRKLTTSTMASASTKRVGTRYRLLDDARLVRDLVDLDADRHLRSGVRNRIFEPLAELRTLAPLVMATTTPTAAAVLAHDAARRVLVAALDGGDVAEPEGRPPAPEPRQWRPRP